LISRVFRLPGFSPVLVALGPSTEFFLPGFFAPCDELFPLEARFFFPPFFSGWGQQPTLPHRSWGTGVKRSHILTTIFPPEILRFLFSPPLLPPLGSERRAPHYPFGGPLSMRVLVDPKVSTRTCTKAFHVGEPFFLSLASLWPKTDAVLAVRGARFPL